jgi:hypothetical protein
MVIALEKAGEWHKPRVPLLMTTAAVCREERNLWSGPRIRDVHDSLGGIAAIEIDAIDDELLCYSELPLQSLAVAFREALGSEIKLGWEDSS